MKLKKVLSDKNKFNKIEKKLNKLNKKLAKKFYVYAVTPFIILPVIISITTDLNEILPLFFFISVIGGLFLLFTNIFIWSLCYKKSHKLGIFDFYNIKSEKFSNKYYEYLKLKKIENIYYENLVYSIKNSNIEEIIDCENEINTEIESLDEIKSKKVIKLVTEKLNNKKEKEQLKKLFEEKRNEIKKEILIKV